MKKILKKHTIPRLDTMFQKGICGYLSKLDAINKIIGHKRIERYGFEDDTDSIIVYTS